MDAKGLDGSSGGTGQTIAESELEALEASTFGGPRLWLAGGLNPENIGAIIGRWRPELVDASSGLESSPGIKDETKMRNYFQEIDHAVLHA
jgi:indole-3-glycerol phosphate synthase/phosphoribosylanthranilate isomerase